MKQHRTYRTCPHCGAALDPGERCDCGMAVVVNPLTAYEDLYPDEVVEIMPGDVDHLAICRYMGYPENCSITIRAKLA